MEHEAEERPADDRLSDIEIRRDKQRFAEQMAALDKSIGGLSRGYRLGLALLIQTGGFSERDLHLMMRGQVLSPEFSGYPCEAFDGSEDLDDLHAIEGRSCDQEPFGDPPLRPVPVARHRLSCPLYERGLRGDRLVPCFNAQKANPRFQSKGIMREAPFLPADLPAAQRQAINFFCNQQTEMTPCRVIHSICQYDLGRGLQNGNLPELFQIRQRPVAPAPVAPPGLREDLGLRRHLEARQAALEEAARLEADAEQLRRDLLRHLIQTERLQRIDVINMIYSVIMVTDEGWLPCRDDPQRTYVSKVAGGEEDEDEGDDEDESDDEDDSDDEDESDDEDDESDEEGDDNDEDEFEDVSPQRRVCPLTVRAMEGDRTVPCCEAQKVPASPERMAQIKARNEQDSEGYWSKQGGHSEDEEDPQPHFFAGEADAPGGPQDIVRLLQIRPCYLLGHAAATSLYRYGQILAAHPELFMDEEGGKT